MPKATTSSQAGLIAATLLLGSLPLARLTPAAANAPGQAAHDGPQVAARIDVAHGVAALPGTSVAIPVTYTANGNEVSSLVFSLDIDERWLSLDPTDADQNGIPDAITFNITRGLRGSAAYSLADTDGEIDVLIYDSIPPLAILASGTIMTVTLMAGSPATDTHAALAMSNDPAPSAGSPAGQGVPLEATGGSVEIKGTGEQPTGTPTAGPPTETATAAATATITFTLTPIVTASVTVPPEVSPTSVTPTATAFATVVPTATGTPALPTATGTRTATNTPSATRTRTPGATRTATAASTRWRVYLAYLAKQASR